MYLGNMSLDIIDTIQDVLYKLGMQLVEIVIFSLHHVIVRLTKIIKGADKKLGNLKIKNF